MVIKNLKVNNAQVNNSLVSILQIKGAKMDIREKELDMLTCDGSANLYKVSISGAVSIDGNLNANMLKVEGRVAVDGSAKLDSVDLKNDLVIDGNLDLNKGVVLGKIKVDGSASLNELDLKKNLFVDGSLTLNKGVILGEVEVDGSANINYAELKSDLTVDGSLNINNVSVSGKTDVDGMASIKESKINDLVVCGKKTKIEFSEVKSIHVKKLNKIQILWRRRQVVRLIDSQVHGDIIFDSGDGEVILQNGATVDGKIVGGKITTN